MFDFAKIEKLMKKQGGVISRAQILKEGISSARLGRAIASGHLVAVFWGVYRRATTPVTPYLTRKAALLWAGPNAVLSHVTAGRLWKLDGLEGEDTEIVWLTVPHGVLLAPPPNVRVIRSKRLVLGRDRGLVAGFPCTSLKRTLYDLSSVLDAENFEIACDSAARDDITLGREMTEYLDRLGTRGRKGRGMLREIIERDELATGSALEVQVRRLLREENIPAPLPQLQICDRFSGEQIGVFDFAWPERHVVILVDGWKYHRSRDMFEEDRIDVGDLVASGWKPIPVTARRIRRDRSRLITRIRAVLGLTPSVEGI